MKQLNPVNVNTPELTWYKFEHEWNKQLHDKDWKRFEMLAKYFKGGRYLDVGCFNSPYPKYLAEKYPDSEIMASDHCKQLVGYLQKEIPEVIYKTAGAYKLPAPKESLDYIVAGEMIEHLEDPARFIREAKRKLKKGGWLAISTPFEETISQSCIGGKEHMWAFTVRDIEELLGEGTEIDIYRDSCKVIVAWWQKSD